MDTPNAAQLAPDKVHEDVSLHDLNTFGFDVTAHQYYRATTVESLRKVLSKYKPSLILGGGSNVLLKQNVQGLVLHVQLAGITISPTNDDFVEVHCGAGENWHQFVRYTLSQGLGGLENLSLIPGSVGASPIQNIGAYGVEIKDHFVSLKALNRQTLSLESFDAQACMFGYRDSVFKHKLKGQYIITEVTFRLSAKHHLLRTAYGDIREKVEKDDRGVTPHAISDAVIAIRQAKLPDPKEIGNSGSFFKNPVLDQEQFAAFIQRRPDARFYELADGNVKLPAAWLIDQAGWKGFKRGAVGVHDRQALVLVNHGGGTGEEVWKLAEEIQADVHKKFGILLEPEVNVI